MNKKYYAISHGFKNLEPKKTKIQKEKIEIPEKLFNITSNDVYDLNAYGCKGQYESEDEGCQECECSVLCNVIIPYFNYFKIG